MEGLTIREIGEYGDVVGGKVGRGPNTGQHQNLR